MLKEMIKKNKREVKKKNECLFLIANLVLSIFAIAFMIGWEAGMVSVVLGGIKW